MKLESIMHIYNCNNSNMHVPFAVYLVMML